MIEYVALAKMLAPVAGRATAAALHKFVTTKKTAWGVAAAVAEAITEFSVDKKRVRAVVKRRELADAFCDENPQRGAHAAVRLFKTELRQQKTWRELDAIELDRRCRLVVEETAKALVRFLPVPESLALIEARNVVRDDASRTRDDDTRQSLAIIREQTAGSSILARADLPPFIHSDAQALVDNCPRAAGLIEVFTNAIDPADDLARWLDTPPTWLRKAPARTWTVLGLCLSVLGRPVLAAAAIHRSAEELGRIAEWQESAAVIVAERKELRRSKSPKVPTAVRAIHAWQPTGLVTPRDMTAPSNLAAADLYSVADENKRCDTPRTAGLPDGPSVDTPSRLVPFNQACPSSSTPIRPTIDGLLQERLHR